MARTDWTPAVLVTATASLTVVLMVWLAPYLLGPRDERPGPARPRHEAPREEDL